MATILERMRSEQEERRKKAEEQYQAKKAELGLTLDANSNYTQATSTAMSGALGEDDLATEAQGTLSQMMRGRLINTSPEETFDDYFKRTVRPATEFLQDFTRGFLAAGKGRTAVTTRDQAFAEYTELQKLKQNRDQLNQTAANQAAITARSLVNAQKQHRVRMLQAAIASEKNEQSRLMMTKKLMAELGIEYADQATKDSVLDLRTQQVAEQITQNQRFKNPTADTARDLALIGIKSTDPTFPDDLKTLNPQQAKMFEEEFNKAYKNLLPPKSSASSQVSWRVMPRENGYGGIDYVAVNPKNPQQSFDIDNGGPAMPAVKLSEDQRKAVSAADSLFTNSRIVTHVIMQNPEVISKERLIPESALQAFGMEDFDARQVERGFKQMVLEAQRAITGAQATDAERGYIVGLFPKTYGSDPALFVNDLGFAALVAKAQSVRMASGLIGGLDLTDVLKDVYDQFGEAAKEGKAVPWDVNDAVDILREAARRQGKELIFDQQGRVRGMR